MKVVWITQAVCTCIVKTKCGEQSWIQRQIWWGRSRTFMANVSWQHRNPQCWQWLLGSCTLLLGSSGPLWQATHLTRAPTHQRWNIKVPTLSSSSPDQISKVGLVWYGMFWSGMVGYGMRIIMVTCPRGQLHQFHQRQGYGHQPKPFQTWSKGYS